MSSDWVISATGVVSAAGTGSERLHQALCAGVPLARLAGDETPGLLIASLQNFKAKDHIQRRGLRDLSRTSQLACVAAFPLARTLEHADPVEVGVVLGTGWGCLESVVDFEWETCSLKPRFLNPLLFAETVPNIPAGQISIFFGWSGFSLTVSSSGASGLEALRCAVELLEEERSPMIVAGGADAINVPALQVLQSRGQMASTAQSLPLGHQRDGIVGGEGACLLLLESAHHAHQRGAQPVARLRATAGRFNGCGDGQSGPRSADIADVLRELLESARLSARDVDLVASSADASPTDGEEALALHEVFGEGTEAPLLMTPKGILGESWGASGPLAAAAVIECMRTGQVPPRPRGFVTDPSLPPLRLPTETTRTPVHNAVILAHSAGGQASAMLLSSPGVC